MYETIAGGSGAGPGWNGESGVHTHMTNTRITDVEILERRYPVILNEFSIRDGSGGKGKFSGGDGAFSPPCPSIPSLPSPSDLSSLPFLPALLPPSVA